MNNQEFKTKIRTSKAWKELRKKKLKEQKYDPITGKQIRKGANLHHRCLDILQYDNLEEDRFVLLNRNSHDLIHLVYGDERHKKDWRTIIKNLIEQCELMDKYN